MFPRCIWWIDLELIFIMGKMPLFSLGYFLQQLILMLIHSSTSCWCLYTKEIFSQHFASASCSITKHQLKKVQAAQDRQNQNYPLLELKWVTESLINPCHEPHLKYWLDFERCNWVLPVYKVFIILFNSIHTRWKYIVPVWTDKIRNQCCH